MQPQRILGMLRRDSRHGSNRLHHQHDEAESEANVNPMIGRMKIHSIGWVGNPIGFHVDIGRAYFASFTCNKRQWKVGDFCRCGEEIFRIVAAFQATKSFVGSWYNRQEIQKKSHPYILVLPLVQASVQMSLTPALRVRNGNELLLPFSTKWNDSSHIDALPHWLGEPNVAEMEKLSVDILLNSDGSKPNGQYVCSLAMVRRIRNNFQTLNERQYSLLTCDPKQLLKHFVPKKWNRSFRARRVHFVNTSKYSGPHPPYNTEDSSDDETVLQDVSDDYRMEILEQETSTAAKHNEDKEPWRMFCAEEQTEEQTEKRNKAAAKQSDKCIQSTGSQITGKHKSWNVASLCGRNESVDKKRGNDAAHARRLPMEELKVEKDGKTGEPGPLKEARKNTLKSVSFNGLNRPPGEVSENIGDGKEGRRRSNAWTIKAENLGSKYGWNVSTESGIPSLRQNKPYVTTAREEVTTRTHRETAGKPGNFIVEVATQPKHHTSTNGIELLSQVADVYRSGNDLHAVRETAREAAVSGNSPITNEQVAADPVDTRGMSTSSIRDTRKKRRVSVDKIALSKRAGLTRNQRKRLAMLGASRSKADAAKLAHVSRHAKPQSAEGQAHPDPVSTGKRVYGVQGEDWAFLKKQKGEKSGRPENKAKESYLYRRLFPIAKDSTKPARKRKKKSRASWSLNEAAKDMSRDTVGDISY